jgi:hypothetical protein
MGPRTNLQPHRLCARSPENMMAPLLLTVLPFVATFALASMKSDSKCPDTNGRTSRSLPICEG